MPRDSSPAAMGLVRHRLVTFLVFFLLAEGLRSFAPEQLFGFLDFFLTWHFKPPVVSVYIANGYETLSNLNNSASCSLVRPSAANAPRGLSAALNALLTTTYKNHHYGPFASRYALIVSIRTLHVAMQFRLYLQLVSCPNEWLALRRSLDPYSLAG